MITIKIDGKTYKFLKLFAKNAEDVIKLWIDTGNLEEVKENKEPETSILQKLRGELQGYIKQYNDERDEPDQTVRDICEYLLTSLETPQFTRGQEIEEVPEFISPKQYVGENIYTTDPKGDQIELLTKTLNQVIRKIK